jgi:hypothetical protein
MGPEDGISGEELRRALQPVSPAPRPPWFHFVVVPAMILVLVVIYSLIAKGCR